MRATTITLGSLLLAGALSTQAHAQSHGNPFFYALPPAPDACGPGTYCTNYCGAVYGPNYCVRPPWEPYNGERPCLPGRPKILDRYWGNPEVDMPPPPQGPLGFPTHPYARSPRDFFMLD